MHFAAEHALCIGFSESKTSTTMSIVYAMSERMAAPGRLVGVLNIYQRHDTTSSYDTKTQS